jgi:hypothetical protein
MRLHLQKISLISLLLISSIAILTSLVIHDTHALSGSDWHAGNIISDSIFYDNTAMSVQDVQTFLNQQNPTCDTNGTQPATEYGRSDLTHAQYAALQGWPGPPYVCLKDYYQVPQSSPDTNNLTTNVIPAGSISAAQIIKNAADAYGINPKALLVTLQKESPGPLVTDTWPLPSQYRNAMGYGCPDTAPCDPTYEGFYNQMTNAAWQFRQYRNNPTNYRIQPLQTDSVLYNPNSGCGSSSIYIETFATAGLYTYTPYQPNQAALNNLYGSGDSCSSYGNRNFWRIFNNWFGPTTGTKIIKSATDPTIYVYSGGKKLPIPNYDMFLAYGFDKIGVTTVSSSYLNGLTTGNPLTLLSRYSDGTIQLIDRGYRYTVPSSDVCTAWGLDCNNSAVVNSLDKDVFNSTTWEGLLQPLMAYNGTTYKMISGTRSPFLNQDAVVQNGYTSGQVSAIRAASNAAQPLGPLLPSNNTSFQLSNGGIMVYTKGQYVSVGSVDLFYRWGLDKMYVATLPPSSWDTQVPAATANLSDFYISFGTTKLLIDGGRKIDLSSSFNNWPVAPTANPYFGDLLNNLPLVSTTPQTCFRTSTGDILVVENSQRRSIRLFDDMYKLGCSPDTLVPLSDSSLSMLSSGPDKLTQDRLFKVSGQAGIYMTTSDTTSVALPSFGYVTAFGQQDSDVALVSSATLQQYAPQGSVSSIAGNTTYGTYFLYSPDGVRYYFGDSVFNAWGVNKQNIPTYNNNIGWRDALRPATLFARTPDGAIYYASSGSRHLITSYAAFLRLGGTSSNTMNVLSDFINNIPSGSDIN